MNSNLLSIKQFGQKIWLDNLSRHLIYSGLLQQLITLDGLAGVTSNPTIFHKAISQDSNYQADLLQVKQSNLALENRYEALVIPDIQAACDLFLPLYNSSQQEEGYVSFEISPHLANDTLQTVNVGRRLWQAINKPNLMVKVPATLAGIQAFTQLIAEGINVNITLLFSLTQVINTWHGYLNGLTIRHSKGLPLSSIKAVASFFLSRIDNAVDEQLPLQLQGKTAINLAKTAYLAYQDIFTSNQFAPLKALGAKPQDLLWASTGTKNPNYSDVLYVEELIGPNTINTLPDATLEAFKDHGQARASLTQNLYQAPQIIEQIKQYVNLEEIGENLQQAGLKLFAASFDDLLSLVQ